MERRDETARVWPGRHQPLGATWSAEATNFAVWAPEATAVGVCLFDDDGAETRHRSPSTRSASGTAHVPGVAAGQRYGFRVARAVGPRARAAASTPPSCCSTPTPGRSPASSASDPAILGHDAGDARTRSDRDSAPYVPRSVVVARRRSTGAATAAAAPVARHGHLRAARQGLHPAARPASPSSCAARTPGWHARRDRPPQRPRRHRGRAAAGAPVLHRAGASPAAGMANYWGYNSLGFFAPHAAYASAGDRGAAGHRVQADGQGVPRGRASR